MSEALKRFSEYDEISLNACRSILPKAIYYLRDIMSALKRGNVRCVSLRNIREILDLTLNVIKLNYKKVGL